jgi:hypothetical protein
VYDHGFVVDAVVDHAVMAGHLNSARGCFMPMQALAELGDLGGMSMVEPAMSLSRLSQRAQLMMHGVEGVACSSSRGEVHCASRVVADLDECAIRCWERVREQPVCDKAVLERELVMHLGIARAPVQAGRIRLVVRDEDANVSFTQVVVRYKVCLNRGRNHAVPKDIKATVRCAMLIRQYHGKVAYLICTYAACDGAAYVHRWRERSNVD